MRFSTSGDDFRNSIAAAGDAIDSSSASDSRSWCESFGTVASASAPSLNSAYACRPLRRATFAASCRNRLRAVESIGPSRFGERSKQIRTSAHEASPTADASVRNGARSRFSIDANSPGAASRHAPASSYERSATCSTSDTSRAISPSVRVESSPGLAPK